MTSIRKLGEPGDLGWVVQAHAEIYAAEYGWGASYETLIAQIVTAYASEHDDSREAAWIAEVDQRENTRGTVVLSTLAIEGRVNGPTPLPLGQAVRVKLVEADIAKRVVAFELVD